MFLNNIIHFFIWETSDRYGQCKMEFNSIQHDKRVGNECTYHPEYQCAEIVQFQRAFFDIRKPTKMDAWTLIKQSKFRELGSNILTLGFVARLFLPPALALLVGR